MSLFDAMYIALSGMNAASAQMTMCASNIANLDTPGYRSLRTNLMSLPNYGGVDVGNLTADPAQGGIDQYGQQSSNVDLATEMVGMSLATHLYDANATVLRASSSMTGTLLDMFDNQTRPGL